MSLVRNGDYEEQTERARTREERRQITYTNLVTLMLQNEKIGELTKGDKAVFTIDRTTNNITDIDTTKLAHLLNKPSSDGTIAPEYELYKGLLTHFDDDAERLATFMMNSLNRLEIDYSNPEQYFYLARNRDVEQTYDNSTLDSWFSRVMGRFDKHVTNDPSFEEAQYDGDRKWEL